MKVEIVAPQRLLNHEQIEAVETLKTVAVGQGVGGIGVTAQQNTRPARADLLQYFDVPARLHLDLNALVSGGQLGFDLLQQLLVRILDTDAHATGDFALRAAEQLPQRSSLLLRFGIPDRVFQRRFGHAMFPYARQQSRYLGSRL